MLHHGLKKKQAFIRLNIMDGVLILVDTAGIFKRGLRVNIRIGLLLHKNSWTGSVIGAKVAK